MPERSRKSPPSPPKNAHAAALGRLGGLKGGPARAAKLTQDERRDIARRAARARWSQPHTRAAPSPTDRSAIPDPLGQSAAERYRTLVEQVPAVVYIDALDANGTTVYISPQVVDLLGYPLEMWHEDPGIWFQTLYPEDREAVFDEYMRHRDEGGPWTMEYRMLSRDGRVVWIREDGAVLRDEQGERIAVQGVMLDITKQKEAEEQLIRLDRTKDALLHAVSHDLRGPLSGVLGATTLINSDQVELTDADRATLLQGMANSAHKMDRIVSNLLDMDRLERGLIQPVTQSVDVAHLLRRVVAETDVSPDRVIHVDVPEQPLMVPADPGLLERIVENLILNAAKHTPTDAQIWVRARPDPDGGVLVLVEDSGAGVAPESRLRIFSPFERDTEEHMPGAGIGLSLVHQFSELHGGRAWVEDRDGGGASFRVRLPGHGHTRANS